MPGLKIKPQRDLSVGKYLRSEARLEINTNQLKHIRLFIHVCIISREQLTVGEIWKEKCQWEMKRQIHDLEWERE